MAQRECQAHTHCLSDMKAFGQTRRNKSRLIISKPILNAEVKVWKNPGVEWVHGLACSQFIPSQSLQRRNREQRESNQIK